MLKSVSFIEKYFVTTIFIFVISGLLFPTYFAWVKHIIYPLLAFIAFCVGLTLNFTNFKTVWVNRKIITTILSFKYTLIPIITFITCKLLNLPIIYTVGLVTLTCCPAANTANILCFLSKGDTAMIVATTICGAMLAPIITPVIVFILLHKIVHIQFVDVALMIATAILIPMLFGILINYFFHNTILKIKKEIPSIGILSISIILAGILSQHAEHIYMLNIKIIFTCIGLISFFLIFGFVLSKKIKSQISSSIAMSYELGTFDGVLGILLAMQIAGKDAGIAVATFAILNIIIGSIASKIFVSNIFLRYIK